MEQRPIVENYIYSEIEDLYTGRKDCTGLRTIHIERNNYIK